MSLSIGQESQFSDDVRKEHVDLTANQTRDGSTISASIQEIKQLSPTIKGFTLKKSPGSGNPMFKAGQWVDFFIPGLDKIGGFSMCSAPDQLAKENTLDLAIKFSTWPPALWLHTKAEIGSQVMMRIGGDYHYPNAVTDKVNSDHNLLLIAGGVGINPLVSIMRHVVSQDEAATAEKKTSKIHLLYSASRENELIFKTDLDKVYHDTARNISTQYFVTKEPSKSDDVIEGRLTTNHLKQAIEKLSDKPTFCYLCGPTPMIQSLVSQLIALGLSKNNIFFELWW